jgi:hypothetical protein
MIKLTFGIFLTGLVLTACASPKFPESGINTPYDGKWSGRLLSEDHPCKTRLMFASGEVRYGYLKGVIKENSKKTAEVWGQLGDSGKLDGLLGLYGVSGGKADIQFSSNSASGKWESRDCKGTVELIKG